MTPLITQLTYEGLIDEFFNVRHSCVKLPSDKFLAPAAATSASAGLEDPAIADSRPATKQVLILKLKKSCCLIP